MKKNILIVTVLAAILSLILLSCASTQKYTDLENRNKQLEAELDTAKNENEQSKLKIGNMEKQIADLKKKNEEQKAQAERDLSIVKKEVEEQKAASELDKAALKQTHDTLVKNLKKEIEQGKITVEQVKGRLTMKVAEELFFDTGKADIKPEGKDVLTRIGNILKNIPEKNIRIEGHTDNVPIGPSLRAKYPTNWELGSARATNVARFLQENAGIDPLRLSAVSYGEYRPVESNRSEAGKARNRRIEIILIDRDLDLAKKMREYLK